MSFGSIVVKMAKGICIDAITSFVGEQGDFSTNVLDWSKFVCGDGGEREEEGEYGREPSFSTNCSGYVLRHIQFPSLRVGFLRGIRPAAVSWYSLRHLL